MRNVVIAGYARSPFHLAGKGALARVRPDDLAASVIRALIERTGANPAEIEDIVLGCAFPEGEQGLNVARLIGLLADLPLSVGGMSLVRAGHSGRLITTASIQVAHAQPGRRKRASAMVVATTAIASRPQSSARLAHPATTSTSSSEPNASGPPSRPSRASSPCRPIASATSGKQTSR